jgi:hypothetical protein
MPCLPAMRSEPKIGRCSHPSSPRAGSTTSTPSLTSPKPSRLSSTVTHKARSKTSCPGDSERRQPQVLRGSSKRLPTNSRRSTFLGLRTHLPQHATAVQRVHVRLQLGVPPDRLQKIITFHATGVVGARSLSSSSRNSLARNAAQLGSLSGLSP